MKTESSIDLSRIGIGTWAIGGKDHRDVEITDRQEDGVYVNVLVYMFSRGLNFTEISLGYGHGNSIKLFKKAIEEGGISRRDLFITNSLYPRDLKNIFHLSHDVEDFYGILDTDYADSTLVTQSLITKFGPDTVYPYLHQLLDSGRSRYVSLSNASPDFINGFKQEFGDKFFAHEGHLSFEVRAVQDKGVFEICRKLDVTNIIWRPLRKNGTSRLNWPLLSELSEKYSRTQNQIILNWMTHQGFYPMVMSTDRRHIDENISALEFSMSDRDYHRVNNFRPPDYHPPEVDWDKTGKGESIVTLSNDFEKHIG